MCRFRWTTATRSPAGAWPDHWLDPIHEYDGHDVDGSCESRAGEDWLVGELGALYAQHGVEYAVDDVSGAALDPEAVRKGRQVEMDYFSGMRVYDRVPRSEQLETGGPIIGTKWIDINKGDAEHPNIRCRLVGKEFKTTPDDALYRLKHCDWCSVELLLSRRTVDTGKLW